jgi:transposase
MPVRIMITLGTTADGTHAGRLIEGITAEYFLADRGYDNDAIIAQAEQQGMQPTSPSRTPRKMQREYAKDLSRRRHLVENASLPRKRWRGIATRYAKNTASFLAAVQIRCLALWANIL